MTNSCFEKNSTLWVLREEELNSDLPVLPDLMSAATGVADQLLDVIRQPAFSLSLLDMLKRELVALLASQRGKMHFTGMVSSSQEEKRKKILADIIVIQDKFNALESIISNMPPYVANKTNFLDFEDKYKKLVIEAAKRGERANDQIDSLISEGFLSQNDADLIRSNLPGSAARTSIYGKQTINELRDRYYTIDRTEGVEAKAPRAGSVGGYTVKIGGKPVEDFYGSVPSINIDGTGTIDGLDIEVVPKAPIKKAGKRPDIPSGNLVSEDFYFEISACSALDLLDFISDIQASINISFNGIKSCLTALKAVLAGTPIFTIGKITNTTIENINKVKDDMNRFVGIVTKPPNRILSIGASLSPVANSDALDPTSVNKTLCGINKDLYCSIHSNLRGISENFNLELEALSFGFGQDGEDDSILPDFNFSLPNIIASIESFIDSVEPDLQLSLSATEKLKGDLCLFLSKKIKATPKSLGIAIAAMLLLYGKFNSFSFDFGIDVNPELLSLLDRIKSFGMGPAAQMLGDGDIEGFLGLGSPEEGTYAGMVAKCIDSAISEEMSAEVSSRLAILSSASKTRAEREVAGAKIRNKMAARIGKSSGSDTAKTVQELGRTLL